MPRFLFVLVCIAIFAAVGLVACTAEGQSAESQNGEGQNAEGPQNIWVVDVQIAHPGDDDIGWHTYVYMYESGSLEFEWDGQNIVAAQNGAVDDFAPKYERLVDYINDKLNNYGQFPEVLEESEWTVSLGVTIGQRLERELRVKITEEMAHKIRSEMAALVGLKAPVQTPKTQ